jgi:CRP/FNR family transcriptional regulator, cyclic AMP receptor protein
VTQLSAADRALLNENPFFCGLSAPLRDALSLSGRRRILQHGELLHQKGDAPSGWYCVLSGAIKVRSFAPDGREVALAFLEPGTWFGEISLFDGEPRTHDGVAHGETTVWIISPAEFARLLAEFPDLAIHIAKLQSRRLRLAFAALEEVNLLPLEARLARQVLALARTYGEAGPDGAITIRIKLPQEDLAQLVGASRQRVNAVLSQWARQGWFTMRYGQAIVHQADAIRALTAPDAT